MPTAEPKPRVLEPVEVARWRLSELVRAGYTWDQGVLLAARPEVDLHRAIDLLRKGCPGEIAVKILV
jgi:hypothetical protein